MKVPPKITPEQVALAIRFFAPPAPEKQADKIVVQSNADLTKPLSDEK